MSDREEAVCKLEIALGYIFAKTAIHKFLSSKIILYKTYLFTVDKIFLLSSREAYIFLKNFHKQKMKLPKYKKLLSSLYKYFFDFLVVFAGVFLAFWLSEYQAEKNSKKKKQEIYNAIYEELISFYESGRIENEKGFVNFFMDADQRSDSLIALKKIPIKTNLYGDYWKIPIINSFVQNGLLREIDIEILKKITRFNTVHQNFLENIRDYNEFYDKYVTAEYDKGIEHFYEAGTNKLKPKYLYLEDALEGIAQFAELLVTLSKELSSEIKEKHIEE